MASKAKKTSKIYPFSDAFEHRGDHVHLVRPVNLHGHAGYGQGTGLSLYSAHGPGMFKMADVIGQDFEAEDRDGVLHISKWLKPKKVAKAKAKAKPAKKSSRKGGKR